MEAGDEAVLARRPLALDEVLDEAGQPRVVEPGEHARLGLEEARVRRRRVGLAQDLEHAGGGGAQVGDEPGDDVAAAAQLAVDAIALLDHPSHALHHRPPPLPESSRGLCAKSPGSQAVSGSGGLERDAGLW